MNIEQSTIKVGSLNVQVIRKPIKNLHIGVYPPEGHVRIAAPMRLDNEAIRLAVISRIGWIKRQRERLLAQPRESKREMITGESHYVWGKRYRLNILEKEGAIRIHLKGKRRIYLSVPPGTDADRRAKLLDNWYRREIKKKIPPLIDKWEKALNVKVSKWGVKKMKTKWGSCNPEAANIWINLELAKKPPECLEYVVLHEILHLLERKHNDRFRNLLDRWMPQWKRVRDELNRLPLSL